MGEFHTRGRTISKKAAAIGEAMLYLDQASGTFPPSISQADHDRIVLAHGRIENVVSRFTQMLAIPVA